MADVLKLQTLAGVEVFRVDDSGNVYAAGTISSTGADPDDFGAAGIKADVIAESTAAAGVTIDGLLIKDESIDASGSGIATGDFNLTLKANLADAWSIKDSTGDMVVFTTTTATPGIAMTFARTGAGNALSVASTWNSATATGVGLAVSSSQITTARTSGSLIGVQSTVVSLTGSSAGTDHYAFAAAVTVGEATADHYAFRQGAGFDETIDSSACATTEAGWLVAANLADAWHLKSASLTYAVLRTTIAAPGIDETFTLTATGDAHNIQAVVNSATGVVQALDVGITTSTTNHTSGLLSAIRASTTSLAGDTGGDFVCLELVSTDGGGTTPVHSGLYCASPLDALIKVSADGMGAFVVGATMTLSPETDAESGYFRVRIGATVYQVPIYAA